MGLKSILEKDYISSYKARDAVRVAVLRLLKTAIKNQEIELRRELTEDEVLDALAKQVKQRRESIEQYAKAGRTDLVQAESRELEVLSGYLPSPLSEEDLRAAVDQAVAELGASGLKDMGRVMQELLNSHKGRVDGKKASQVVRSRLAS
ncbi:MAG: GatB/YqeY domain-containing protein [Desulfovibrionaceae bacterium]|nr:GatB/YqeY domain-containing protein [Desulfovibrionaceae bacterium]